MSCLSVSLTSFKVKPDTISKYDVAWCIFRDVALFCWHAVLLYFAVSADPSQKQSIQDSNIVGWLIIDNLVTLVRLALHPLQYIANQRMPMATLDFTWVDYFTPHFSICKMQLYQLLEFMTYFNWIFGAWIIRPSEVGSFVVQATYLEILIPLIVYAAFAFIYISAYFINRISDGYCLPGLQFKYHGFPYCPEIGFDITRWRREGESIADFRVRARREYNAMNILVTQQPVNAFPMTTVDLKLTEEELNELKIVVYQKKNLQSVSKLTLVEQPNNLQSVSRMTLQEPMDTLPEETVLQADKVDVDTEEINENEKSTDETCAMCLEDYEDNDQLRELYCGHRYHSACIDVYLLNQKRICPVCNADAVGRPVTIVQVTPEREIPDELDTHIRRLNSNPNLRFEAHIGETYSRFDE
ncbi:E3 ubiquitin-protein ligase rnf13 [Boothiomyces sp. JEL0866]|nr:E3 ubiquitin-protein ligase rnf13 [Boothiomyces sp. JEL0866]